MKGRWTLVALIASLALNLFLIGAAAGVVALGARIVHESGGRAAVRPMAALRRGAAALTPAERQAFRVTLRAAVLTSRPDIHQARELRREVWGSIGEAAFDPAAAKAKLEQARGLDLKSRTRIEDAVVDFTSALPAADRAKFGAAVRTAMPDGPAAPPAPPPRASRVP